MPIPEDDQWFVEITDYDGEVEVQSADGMCVCTMAEPNDVERAERIAALPELVAACRLAYSALAGYRDVCKIQGCEPYIPDLTPLVDEVRAALEKAKGF